jgi:hypothetical protein
MQKFPNLRYNCLRIFFVASQNSNILSLLYYAYLLVRHTSNKSTLKMFIN